MRRKTGLRIAGAISLILALSACQGVREQLGLTKQSPDEFRVIARAPLSLPPDFILRPPEPGIPRPQEGTAAQQARNAVFRLEQPKTQPLTEQVKTDGRTLGELSLLKAAGADKADPGIRRALDLETQQLNAESESFINALVFWRDKEIPGRVVDATAEARRLRENAALGKAVTAGETPTIERKSKALLEGLF
ncbi:MAG: DUF3035 domain-containing protein [Proteobacteria bacterium]|nr:DUF3035 domain-containing protein [Pseudomonadota bacterium]